MIPQCDVTSFSRIAIPHLEALVRSNRAVMESLTKRLVEDVTLGRSLFVFGSGHSGLFPLELYHRAGGASFVIPIVADYLLPHAGPPVVRVLEREPRSALPLLARARANSGEMLWVASQSGVNGAAVEVAVQARAQGLHVVAFTSLVHSRAMTSRHPSGKRLFEVASQVVDLGGFVGDAAVPIAKDLSAGPLSTLGAALLGHSVLVAACAELEGLGHRCVYTSVNTADGEKRNQGIEARASERDPLLRG